MSNAAYVFALIISFLGYLADGHAATGVVSPGFATNPHPSISIMEATGPYEYKTYLGGEAYMCDAWIWAFGGSNSGRVPVNIYWTGEMYQPGNGGTYCFGEFVKSNMSYDEAKETMSRILSRPISAQYYSSAVHGYADRADTCSFAVSFRYGAPLYRNRIVAYANKNFLKPDECHMESMPEPVQCTVQSPGTITHRTINVGSVRATASGTLNVQCSGETDVTVAVGDTYLDLGSTDGQITSRFYVEETGQKTARLHANPRVDVTLISVIDTVTTRPGVYHGAKLITVTWD